VIPCSSSTERRGRGTASGAHSTADLARVAGRDRHVAGARTARESRRPLRAGVRARTADAGPHPLRGPRDHPRPGRRHRGRRRQPRPGGPRDLHRVLGFTKTCSSAGTPWSGRRIVERLESGFSPLPRAPRSEGADRRHPLGRRAADARDRPRLMTRPRLLSSTSPRSGWRPDPRARDLPGDSAHQTRTGVAVLLVEQNARRALALASADMCSRPGGSSHRHQRGAHVRSARPHCLPRGSIGVRNDVAG